MAYIGVALAVVMFAGLADRSAPRPFALAAALLLVYLGVCLVEPFFGLVATVSLALVNDIVTVSWFPFVKNMSSPESILFVGGFMSISPLELGLGTLTVALLARHDTDSRLLFHTSRLSTPVLVFIGFIGVGAVYGVGTGGDKYIALTEVRAFAHLFLLFFICVATCRTARHYRILLMAMFLGVALHALLSMRYIASLPPTERAASEGIMAHPAALQMVPVFAAAVASFLFRGISWRLRLIAIVAAALCLPVFFAAKRRAAMVSLVAALIVAAVVLFWRQRRRFLKIVPVVALVFAGYVGAFWNSTSSAAFPAQAVKAVIAPTELSERDSSSDGYRVIENIDLNFTIQSAKITGIGFGNPFYRPYALPDIGVFILNAYIPHNSVLWIWVSTGFGGFAAMIYLVVKALFLAGDKLRRVPAGDDVVVGICLASFVPAFMVFAYVDIAWEPATMVVLAVSLAYCGARIGAPPISGPPPNRDHTIERRASSSTERAVPAMRRA